MHLSLVALLSSLVLVEAVVAANVNWQKYGTRVIAEIGSMRPRRSKAAPFSTAFMFYVQAADRTMTPLFKAAKHKPLTIVVPVNLEFKKYIERYGGDMLDPDLQNTKEFVERWDGEFEYFFLKDSTFSTEELVEGETLLFDTFKRSPAGDWPLQMAVRKNPALNNVTLEQNVTYTATFYAGAGSAGNITLPDYALTNGFTQAHATDFWPVQPTSLSSSIATLGNEAWATLISKLPEAAALDSQRNFTLLLPPSSTISSALFTLSSSSLSDFLAAHLISDERVLLRATPQDVGGMTVGSKWVVGRGDGEGGVNATVVEQDVLSSGGLIQVIDRSLYVVSNATTAAASNGGREEL